jgi:hypothetical protein
MLIVADMEEFMKIVSSIRSFVMKKKVLSKEVFLINKIKSYYKRCFHFQLSQAERAVNK